MSSGLATVVLAAVNVSAMQSTRLALIINS
jgi:hypothetical protein